MLLAFHAAGVGQCADPGAEVRWAGPFASERLVMIRSLLGASRSASRSEVIVPGQWLNTCKACKGESRSMWLLRIAGLLV
jgi:hypothetical protein